MRNTKVLYHEWWTSAPTWPVKPSEKLQMIAGGLWLWVTFRMANLAYHQSYQRLIVFFILTRRKLWALWIAVCDYEAPNSPLGHYAYIADIADIFKPQTKWHEQKYFLRWIREWQRRETEILLNPSAVIFLVYCSLSGFVEWVQF